MKNTKALEGAAAGAIAAAMVVGASPAWLAANGMLAVAGADRFIAAGPLLSAFRGAGAGFLVGWLCGAIVGFGIHESEARRYQGRMRKGGLLLLSVHCGNRDWTRRATDILKTTGATGIGIKAEAKADFGSGEKPRAPTRVVGTLDAPAASVTLVDAKPPEPFPREAPPRDETNRPTVSQQN
ncbi:MAG: DUF3341 domain-containing protein [Bryobacteraceae bacterium]